MINKDTSWLIITNHHPIGRGSIEISPIDFDCLKMTMTSLCGQEWRQS